MSRFINQKSPLEISKEISKRVKSKRRKLKISQIELSKKSGVSLGSVKRFETEFEISLVSLIKIAIALDLEGDFDLLFSNKSYSSIDEVING